VVFPDLRTEFSGISIEIVKVIFQKGLIMKAKKYWIYVMVGLIFCSVLYQTTKVLGYGESNVLEEHKQQKRSTLRGLHGVALFVMGPGVEIEKYGLTESQIRTDVELKLRQSGVKVLSSKERYEMPGSPLFGIFALVHKWPDSDVFSVHVYAKFTQEVVLERNRSILCNATTWETFPVGAVFSSGELQDVRRMVKDHVEEFSNDYLAANLKETKNRLEGLIKPENQATEEVVFTGIPQIKILIENGFQGTPEKLSQSKSIEYKCTITKVDNKYYWTTRENVELIPRQSGIYTTFFATNGAGYVRIIDPEMKKIIFNKGDQSYDYMEHLLLGLSTISYYGTSK